MRVGLVASMGAAVVLLGGSKAIAQEHGQFGLTMGYPAAIGVVWHAIERVGIKGEFTFALSSSEIDTSLPLSGSGRETHTDSFGVGIAGLFFVSRNDNVSTYFSPRFAYAKITAESEGPDFSISLPGPLPIPIPSLDIRSELSTYSFAGSFGAQYSPNRRFSVFGELGLNYASQQTESSPLSFAETEGSAFGVRSAVGVILYIQLTPLTRGRGPRRGRSAASRRSIRVC